ncbi:MAG: hypothetical protein HGB12_01070 [Bacteroidetes bacterium]|nr:hypothetical protein [Bacteroidota bacterium]
MKDIKKIENNKKREYKKPIIEKIKLDNEISMVMMSPPPDPDGSVDPMHFSVNPFKLPNL